LLAGAPGGVKRLRELVLELAVRGRLVPQDASDEPAGVLLGRIRTQYQLLVSEGKAKKDKLLCREFIDEDLPNLPDGWAWTTLGEITLVNPRNNAEDSESVSFVPMTLIGTGFEGSHAQEHRLWKDVKQGFTHFADGDVAVAKITPCFENSKACIFQGWLME